MECKVGNWSRQEYNVQWIKSDGYVISDSEHLYIESVVQNQHEGTYTCAVVHKKHQNQIYNKKIVLKITSESFMEYVDGNIKPCFIIQNHQCP